MYDTGNVPYKHYTHHSVGINKMKTKSNHFDYSNCFSKNIKETKVDKIFNDERYFRQAFVPVT